MSRPADAEVLALLEQGIAICGRWEELVTRQFAALRDGDTASLAMITAGQSRLAEQFVRLEGQWRHIDEQSGESPAGDVIRARQKFVAIVNRMHGLNVRNAKALVTMIVLADMHGARTAASDSTYTRDGGLSARQATLSRHLNREG